MADDSEDDTEVTETDDNEIDGLTDAMTDTTDGSDSSSGANTDSTASSDSAGITPVKMAKNALRKANKQENAGNITIFGDPTLVAGVTVDLKNFGAFSLKYIVSKATHKISGGYTVDVEIRKCLNGY